MEMVAKVRTKAQAKQDTTPGVDEEALMTEAILDRELG